MRVLVGTVVHHPEDARIRHRQIRSLLEAGHSVTYAASFSARGVAPGPEVTGVDLPRAVGRRRLSALRAARRVFAEQATDTDLILVHDPELLLALPRQRPPTVWDVHEDTAAALSLKEWLPRLARPAVAAAVRAGEHMAERHLHLLLAEEGYRSRFSQRHPVVPNTAWVPDSPTPAGADRVVYLGALSLARGLSEMIELARRLAPDIRMELIGDGPGEARRLAERAHASGILHWHGYVPHRAALPLLEGALAGLSLLRDEPNYRVSLPTKVLEYMAYGVPVVSTPLPPAAAVLERHGSGLVVPFGDVDAAEAAVRRLRADAGLRTCLGRAGRLAAVAAYSWHRDGPAFVAQLEAWAAEHGALTTPTRVPA